MDGVRCGGQTPSAAHWLGTDEFGRDILARLVHGSRVSLSVGVVAVSIALLIGGSLGAIARYYVNKCREAGMTALVLDP